MRSRQRRSLLLPPPLPRAGPLRSVALLVLRPLSLPTSFSRTYSDRLSLISRSQSPKTTFTLGSRSSQLALVQTHLVRDSLLALHPTYTFPIITMTTAGDNTPYVVCLLSPR